MPGMYDLTLKQLKLALEQSAQEGYQLFPESRDLNNWNKLAHSSLMSEVWKDIREYGEETVHAPLKELKFSEFIMFGTVGDRKVFESKYFERRKRLSVLTVLVLTEGRERWGEALENLIWAICEESTWVIPAHVGLYVNEYPSGIWDREHAPRETIDLFSSITAFALSETISLVGDALHPWVVERVHKELDRRIIQVYFYDPVPQNWELKTNNWPAVCSAGIGVTAIYEVKDSELLAGMLWRVIEAMRKHLSGFDEEGATPEGVTYWQFGFGFYVYFSEMLRDRTNGRVNLLAGEQIGRIATFPNACMLSGGKVVNFSDSVEDIPINIGLLSRLKEHFPDVAIPKMKPEFNDLFDHWAHFARILLWTSEAVSEDVPAQAIDDKFFQGHQWVISKTWTPKGLYAFAAKGGHNAEPHNHNDLGHFIVHMNGKTMLADLGSGFYTKEYFQPVTRYEMITAGSHGHSVPIVDGFRQGFGENYRTEVIQYASTEAAVEFKLDLTNAYDCTHLNELTRAYNWQRVDCDKGHFRLTITDQAQFSKKPKSFVEVLVSSIKPELIEAGRIKLDEAVISYDAQRFSFDVDTHQVKYLYEDKHTIYRILLSSIEPEQSLNFSISIDF
ncbi:hypothetical protein [Paenibacillus sp. IITD108]|uniref:hypothetical protein n=1 Tax=Paenibacillus sp. IITD108 TaxID=3116649 RepID=UPI002F4239E0